MAPLVSENPLIIFALCDSDVNQRALMKNVQHRVTTSAFPEETCFSSS